MGAFLTATAAKPRFRDFRSLSYDPALWCLLKLSVGVLNPLGPVILFRFALTSCGYKKQPQ